MPTRAPLTVRLSTPGAEQAFDVRDLQFSRSWRGGFKDASVRLLEPLNFRHPMLSPFARMRIDDNRNARTVWEGYLDLPGRSRGDDGDVWQVGGVGGFARLSDRRRPYIVIDRNFDGWELAIKTKAAMNGGISTDPNAEDVDALVINWPDGMVAGAGDPTNGPRTTMKYLGLSLNGQFLGGMSFTHREGGNSTNLRSQLLASTAGVGGSLETARNRASSTSLDTIAASAGSGGQFDTGEVGRDVAFFRMIREAGAATNIADDTWWTAARAIRVSALRKNQAGSFIYGAGQYDNDYVLAHEAVIDALHWFCASSIDIPNAVIDQTFTYQIEQLAYTDPTTMQTVLDDLALFHPDMVWEVLETNAAGLHRFGLRKLSTTPRYLASAIDGWDSPGGEDDLRNEVTVSWRGRTGERMTRSYTAAVPELDQWGLVRNAELVNLTDDLGSEANADRVGAQVLTEVSSPPDAGTLTVSRPIVDLWTGRDVYPWEIETGYRILISDVDIPAQPITEVSYRDSDASAALTVGEPALSTDDLVNIFAKRKRRR